MKRDIMKIIERNRGHIPYRYALSCGDVREVLNCAAKKDNELERLYTAIGCAFYLGFVLGSRATLKGFRERK